MRPYSFILVLIVLAGVCSAQSTQTRDMQLWTDYVLTKHFENGVAVTGQTSLRWWDNISRLAEEHAGGGMAYAPKSWVTFGSWFRFIRQVNELGHVQHEYRTWLEGTVRAPVGAGFSLSDRNRLEWRVLNGVLSERYRDYIRLDHAVHKVTPYVAWEIIYDTRFHEWNQQREYVGARIPVRRHFALEAYYQHQDDQRSHPLGKNALYTAFRFEY